jgi:DNA-binding HxlR family transcriptional regulator
LVDSGRVGPVLGPTGWSGTAGEPTGLAGGSAGSAGESWPDDGPSALVEPCAEGDPSGLAEPCSAAVLSELADEPCLAGEARGPAGGPSSCRAREVLQRVGDKWSVLVIDLLGQGTKRFTELHRSIDGITARMLTVTLRGLERDGIVTRTIHPVIPPRVEYALTPMGQTLLTTIGQLVTWADSHVAEIEAARAAYDARHEPSLG